ncbi:MAG: amidohydrolase family protein [Thermodesulfobacteriota bacterium]
MGETRFVVAGSLIDGSGGGPRRKVFLAMRGGMITAIGPAAELPRSDAGDVDDYSHCTILPALVDCSVCLSRSPSVDWQVRLAAEEAGPEGKTAMLAQHIRYCHIHGVLGVADGDDPDGLVQGVRKREEGEGRIRIRTSGRLCRSRLDCREDSPGGKDFLKVDYSGNIEDEEPPHQRLGPEDLHDMLRLRGERKAVVVANGPEQVAEALDAGCDAIEQGYAMGEDNLRRMADMGVLWIPSVLRARNALLGAGSGGSVCCRFSLRYVAPGTPVPGAEAHWKKVLADQLAQLRLARQLGVGTAVGTGAGGVGLLHGESMAEEMKLFLKAGYSLAETIHCASERGARFFGLEELGALAAGRPATFLITRGGTEQLPRKLSYLEGIYVGGAPSSLYRKNPVKMT